MASRRTKRPQEEAPEAQVAVFTTNPIIWKRELLERWGNPSRMTFWRWQRAGKVPRPEVEIGGKEGWYRKTIEAIEAASTQRREVA
jgi:predicted DNA-binding transcriptional regulator AlpA